MCSKTHIMGRASPRLQPNRHGWGGAGKNSIYSTPYLICIPTLLLPTYRCMYVCTYRTEPRDDDDDDGGGDGGGGAFPLCSVVDIKVYLPGVECRNWIIFRRLDLSTR